MQRLTAPTTNMTTRWPAMILLAGLAVFVLTLAVTA